MKKIHFKDEGQYLLWIMIDDEGNIIETYRYSELKFEPICLNSLKENENLTVKCSGANIEGAFLVEKIEPIES